MTPGRDTGGSPAFAATGKNPH